MTPEQFQQNLAHLHLTAVLPALEDLVKLSPSTPRLDFAVRMRLRGGPETLIVPSSGGLRVEAGKAEGSALNLTFLSPHQLNQTFLGRKAWPPIPSGSIWHLVRIKVFNDLTKLLDQALQPSEQALDESAFLDLHLHLLFKVLMGALPVIASRDPTAAHTLQTTPRGLAQIRMDGLGLRGWVRWDGERLSSGSGEAPSAPDAMISFRDAASAAAALRSQLDATAAVGLGQIEVHGLVPLADGLSVAMDRVETYLQPQ